MNDTTAAPTAAESRVKPDIEPATGSETGPGAEPEKKEDNFFLFLLKLVFIVLIFRSFIFSPFNIPSESMLPTLQNGDYLLAAKWPYGFTSDSLPFGAPLIPGRIFASMPERGDIAIFKHPVDGTDYIKRVIGLPGDTVEMREGQIILNGQPVTKERIGKFEIALSPNTQCHTFAEVVSTSDGTPVCSYVRFRETLPSGKSYEVLDFGPAFQDNYGPVIVPEGAMFVMGDNRDNSQDSRFSATPGGGVGLVPQDLLLARATIIMWSTDGSAQWIKPWTWFTALRAQRLGEGL